MIEIIFIFVLTLYVVTLLYRPKYSNLPPGPWGLPFIGSKPHINLKDCEKDRAKYGDIFMRKFGAGMFVYITDYDISREAFNKLEFADRPHFTFMRMYEEEKMQKSPNGIIFNNGLKWQMNRRFLLQHLRDLGMGKSKIEDIILREVDCLVEDFKTLVHGPSKLPFSINICILNVIWQLVASQRYEFSNYKEVSKFMDIIHDAQGSFGAIGILEQFPIFRYVLPKFLLNYIFKANKIEDASKRFRSLVQGVIDNHTAKIDTENPVDLIDHYICEMKGTSENYSHFSYADLIRTTFDLFVAGNETTSNMVRWVLIYMAQYPDVQEKLQKIIDREVPADRIPGLEHREKLAYLDAIINEVSRHCTFVGVGIFRCTNVDGNLNGYFIPKGTNVQSVPGLTHKDPRYWKCPEEFDPNRFLDSDGKFVQNHRGYQPFGIGKRQCLGEQFARMELFFVLGALLQNFTFSSPNGKKLDMTPQKVIILNLPNDDLLLDIKLRRKTN